jgi:iron(III) transport system substrate-binding protein
MKTALFRPIAAFALVLANALVPAAAQATKDGRTVAQIATYEGADRQARLVDGAKKEGEISIYYAHPIVKNMADAFGQKYGIKVKLWRGGSEAIMQRIMAEARAGRHDVDVFLSTSADTEASVREKLLQEVRSPFHQDLVAGAVPGHRQWAAFNLDVFTASYNTKLVKKEDLPRTYQDLLDPKWKGKLAVEANDHVWWGALSAELGEDATRKLFDNIIATNGMSVRKGHSLLAGLVASGEVPLALTVYSWNPEQLKRKGAPVEGLYLPPLFAYPAAVGMMNRSPSPNAAVLFYDFVLSEGQKLMAEADYGPTSKKVDSHLRAVQGIKLIDAIQALDNQERWVKMYEDAITKKAK